MRITHEQSQVQVPDNQVSEGTMRQIIYWIMVSLILISVVCAGMMVIHWSLNLRLT